MSDFINDYLKLYTSGFFFAQVAVIIFLFAVGLVFTWNVLYTPDKEHKIMAYLLALPAGVGIFVFVGMLVLITGIPYKAPVLIALCLILVAVTILLRFRTAGPIKKPFGNAKELLLLVLSVVLVAIISTCGIIKISLSNDSFYYFATYPRNIVYYGGLRDQFDYFLTNVGQGSAVIYSIPYLFGFGEAFGITEAFNISFILFFGYSLGKITGNRVLAVIASIVLATSTPFVIISHWSMANVFFMEYFFMTIVLARYLMGKRTVRRAALLSLFILTTSLLRMEGCVFVLFMIVIISLLDYSCGEMFIWFGCPPLVIFTWYVYKIYHSYVIDYPYPFLTPLKAAIIIGAYVILLLYLGWFRNKANARFGHVLPYAFLAGMFLVNVALLVINPGRFLVNLKAMMGNFFGQSGWGILPHLTIAFAVVIAVSAFIRTRKGHKLVTGKEELNSGMEANYVIPENGYYLLVTVGFFLVAMASAWARGDTMYEQVGDSANRVMLQIVPLVIFTIVKMLYDVVIKEDEREDGR